MEQEKLQRTIRNLVRMLVNGDYEGVEELSSGQRLSADGLRQAVSEYGRTLNMPPDSRFDADVIQVTGSNPDRWSVVIPLHTVEEGPSDLSLELWVTDADGPMYAVEVDDLHVR